MNTTSFIRNVFLVTAGVLLCSGASVAALYKSVDENGNVTYSDKPPMTPKSETTTKMRNVPPPGDPDAAKKLVKEETAFQERVNEREAAETKAQEDRQQQAEKDRFCRDARMNINQYRDSGHRIYRAGEKPGERVLMDSAAREQEAKRLEEEMKKADCK
jgi:hypothetical protein